MAFGCLLEVVVFLQSTVVMISLSPFYLSFFLSYLTRNTRLLVYYCNFVNPDWSLLNPFTSCSKVTCILNNVHLFLTIVLPCLLLNLDVTFYLLFCSLLYISTIMSPKFIELLGVGVIHSFSPQYAEKKLY